MYNVTAVTEALRGLVGFRPHMDASMEPLAADLTICRSGLWIDKAHPLITAKILNNVAVDTITRSSEPNDESDSNSEAEAVDTLLSFLIRDTIDGAIADVLSALRTRKLLRYEVKSLLPLTQLYDGEGSISDLIQPAGRFVGLQLITNDEELALLPRKLGLQFTGPVTDLPIYVQMGDGNLVQKTTVSTTNSNRMQWATINLTLSGASYYYIGYFEDNLPDGVQAIRRAKSIGNYSCGGCYPPDTTLWNRWRSFISVKAVRRDNEGDPFDSIDDMNYGLNLALAVGCDFGSLIISQQMQLAEAIRQQVIVKLLSEIAYSQQITTLEQQVRQNAMFALKNGEEAKLEKLLDALDIDLSGLSARCLPDTRSATMPVRRTVFNPNRR
ncbi:hypothetical protein [Spirosoma aerolatum]|uniref:hypothetical protein n=1 Tax=Spirosoma aerolatum TaxID=1211326 RepID=UPI0009AE5C49|nr:hypothetical protein [Spirosoma aerolatum]